MTPLPDYAKNTLCRIAAAARPQRFESQPLHPEPSAARLAELEVQIQVLEARNRELLLSLQQLTGG